MREVDLERCSKYQKDIEDYFHVGPLDARELAFIVLGTMIQAKEGESVCFKGPLPAVHERNSLILRKE